MAKPFRDVSGMEVWEYRVVRFLGKSKYGDGLWECKCNCGKIFQLNLGTITSGKQKSCGCYRKNRSTPDRFTNLKHGYTGNGTIQPEAKSYYCAKNRCVNAKNNSYKYYGGRGIQFRLSSLKELLDDIGNKPSPKHSIDRIDNNGHYEKGNLKWSTPKEQAANRRKPFAAKI